MRSNAIPKVYHSFEEFERDELYRLDSMTVSLDSIDDMLDQMFGGHATTPKFDDADEVDESDPLRQLTHNRKSR